MTFFFLANIILSKLVLNTSVYCKMVILARLASQGLTFLTISNNQNHATISSF